MRTPNKTDTLDVFVLLLLCERAHANIVALNYAPVAVLRFYVLWRTMWCDGDNTRCAHNTLTPASAVHATMYDMFSRVFARACDHIIIANDSLEYFRFASARPCDIVASSSRAQSVQEVCV